jgi:hypothetical protein
VSRITDVSDRIARFTDGNANVHFFTKIPAWPGVGSTAGLMNSLWMQQGKPGPGSAPGASSIPTRATAGALALINPGGGRQKWLMTAGASSNWCGGVTVYDRLFHCSGLSGTSTAVQTPAAAALTRYTSGVGNRIYLEIYTSLGATATTITVVYVNQSGATQTVAGIPFVTATLPQTISFAIQVPLLDGDTGVRSVTSVQLSNSTGAVGNFGVTIAHPLWESLIANSGGGANTCSAVLEDVEVLTDACLALMIAQASAGCTFMQGFYILGEK